MKSISKIEKYVPPDATHRFVHFKVFFYLIIPLDTPNALPNNGFFCNRRSSASNANANAKFRRDLTNHPQDI